MLTVIGVRFRTAGKIYYFDPVSYTHLGMSDPWKRRDPCTVCKPQRTNTSVNVLCDET